MNPIFRNSLRYNSSSLHEIEGSIDETPITHYDMRNIERKQKRTKQIHNRQ